MRKAFRMKLRPGCAKEYARRHDEIWPEMLDMLKRYGGSDYSIYLDEETLDVFAELTIRDEDEWAGSTSDPVCQRWREHMADVLLTNPDSSPVSRSLKRVFYME